MLPAAGKLLKVLFVTMFVFSTFGCQLFGGLINYGPQYANLSATPFGEANYYANNFNDISSGFVVCFELLVVNNWFIIADGFVAVANPVIARLFFVSVYVFGVLVCLNIVIAFAIEAFNIEHQAQKNGHASGDSRRPSTAETDEQGVREHSNSIIDAAQRFRPVVPIGLQASRSLKDRLNKMKSKPRPLAEQRGDSPACEQELEVVHAAGRTAPSSAGDQYI